MSRSTPTELLVAVHHDSPQHKSLLVSIDGESVRAKWIPRSLVESFELTGKSTNGTGPGGYKTTFPLANLTIPEWLALREGLI